MLLGSPVSHHRGTHSVRTNESIGFECMTDETMPEIENIIVIKLWYLSVFGLLWRRPVPLLINDYFIIIFNLYLIIKKIMKWF